MLSKKDDGEILALMFYVGAILIANGRYTFAKMLEVFTLIIFSITFSAQIMTYRTLLLAFPNFLNKSSNEKLMLGQYIYYFQFPP